MSRLRGPSNPSAKSAADDQDDVLELTTAQKMTPAQRIDALALSSLKTVLPLCKTEKGGIAAALLFCIAVVASSDN